MPTLNTVPAPFDEALAATLPAASPSPSPTTWSARQAELLARYHALGFPINRQEAWKYIDLRAVQQTRFAAPPVPAAAVHCPADVPSAPRLVFANGRYVPGASDLSGLPPGVIALDLATALQEPACQPYLKQHLFKGLAETPDAFVALNGGLMQDGVFLSVPAGLRVETPIRVVFLSQPSADGTPWMAHPHGLIHVEGGASVSVDVMLIGLADGPRPPAANLLNTVFEVVAHPEAQVEVNWLLDDPTPITHLTHTLAHVEADAQIAVNTVALRGALARHAVTMTYEAETARGVLNGLSVLHGTSAVHHHTRVEHTLPHCTTEQVYKGIVADAAKLEFDGTIIVHPHAQKTDAKQQNKNLLLSEDARVWSRPQLRIDADDVKCAHGATVGQLNPDELFYLASRGLSPEVARAMLVTGFATEVLQRIQQPATRDAFLRRVRAVLTWEAPTETETA